MGHYTYIWIFQVRSDRVEDFLRHYDSTGSWAILFRRAPGYIGTRLLRDRHDPLRFLTVDDWESEEQYRAFRERFSSEYDRLDRTCEGLTVTETPLGQFLDPVA
jgi:heme-degrading monooxygenase HmoA